MANKKKEEEVVETPVEEVEETTEEVTEEEEVVEENPKGYAVYDSKGFYIRTYTAKLHKAKASEYAKEYAKKIEGKVVKE